MYSDMSGFNSRHTLSRYRSDGGRENFKYTLGFVNTAVGGLKGEREGGAYPIRMSSVFLGQTEPRSNQVGTALRGGPMSRTRRILVLRVTGTLPLMAKS